MMIKNPLIPAVMASLIGSVPAMKLEQLCFDCLSEVFTFIEVGQWHTLQILGEEVHPYFEIGLKLAAKRLFPGYPIRFDECSFSGVINSLVLQPGRAELIGDDGPNPELFPSVYTGDAIISEVLKPGEHDSAMIECVKVDFMVLRSKEKTTIVNFKTKNKREISNIQHWQMLPKFVDEHTMGFLEEDGNTRTSVLKINHIREDGSFETVKTIPTGCSHKYALRKVNENDGYSDLEALIVEDKSRQEFTVHIYDALTGEQKRDPFQINLTVDCKLHSVFSFFNDDGGILLFIVETTAAQKDDEVAHSTILGIDMDNRNLLFNAALPGINCLPYNSPNHRRIAFDTRKGPSHPLWSMLDVHQNLRWKIPNSEKVNSIQWLSEDLFVAVSDDSYQVRSANQFGRLIYECNRDSQSPNMPCDQPVPFKDIRFSKRGNFYPGFVYADLNQGYFFKIDFVRT